MNVRITGVHGLFVKKNSVKNILILKNEVLE